MPLKSLHDHFTAPKKKQKILGVIVDATRPYKTEKAPDFTTKIKIIDETLNCTTANMNNPKKYIHLFLYTKTLATAPDITEIGDIIYAKHFDLELYEQTTEVKARKRGNFSKFYVFKGNPTDSNDFSIKFTDDPQAYEPKIDLVSKIEMLRHWSRSFFRENSLLKMNWFGTKQIHVLGNQQSKDFDMILRLKGVKNTNKEALVVLEMTDSKNQSFFLQFPRRNEFKVGDVMKIRSVQKIEGDGDLFPNSYSSVMRIPGYYYDVRNFDRDFAYEVVKPAGVVSSSRIEEEKNEPIQEEFTEETTVLSTIIKKGYEDLEKTKNVTELKEVLETINSYKLGRIGQEQAKKMIFRVRCYIFDISPEDLGSALKFLCVKCKKMAAFKAGEVRHCCNAICKTIWQIRFAVKDASIDDEPKHLELYVCDFDGNGSEIFKGFRPNIIQSVNFQEMGNKYKLITQQIMDLSTGDYLSEFIIEPLMFDKEILYRIVDTKFNQQ